MVVDFGFLKDLMMREIHLPCDHGMILYDKDHTVINMIGVSPDTPEDRYPKVLKIQWLPVVPTAENLAKYWFDRMQDAVVILSGGRGRLVGVEVHETPNCQAVYNVEDY